MSDRRRRSPSDQQRECLHSALSADEFSVYISIWFIPRAIWSWWVDLWPSYTKMVPSHTKRRERHHVCYRAERRWSARHDWRPLGPILCGRGFVRFDQSCVDLSDRRSIDLDADHGSRRYDRVSKFDRLLRVRGSRRN